MVSPPSCKALHIMWWITFVDFKKDLAPIFKILSHEVISRLDNVWPVDFLWHPITLDHDPSMHNISDIIIISIRCSVILSYASWYYWWRVAPKNSSRKSFSGLWLTARPPLRTFFGQSGLVSHEGSSTWVLLFQLLGCPLLSREGREVDLCRSCPHREDDFSGANLPPVS